MAKTKDPRVKQGKALRNEAIRTYFDMRYNAGFRYDVIIEDLILKWGLAESTLSQIINKTGGYKD